MQKGNRGAAHCLNRNHFQKDSNTKGCVYQHIYLSFSGTVHRFCCCKHSILINAMYCYCVEDLGLSISHERQALVELTTLLLLASCLAVSGARTCCVNAASLVWLWDNNRTEASIIILVPLFPLCSFFLVAVLTEHPFWNTMTFFLAATN